MRFSASVAVWRMDLANMSSWRSDFLFMWNLIFIFDDYSKFPSLPCALRIYSEDAHLPKGKILKHPMP